MDAKAPSGNCQFIKLGNIIFRFKLVVYEYYSFLHSLGGVHWSEKENLKINHFLHSWMETVQEFENSTAVKLYLISYLILYYYS